MYYTIGNNYLPVWKEFDELFDFYAGVLDNMETLGVKNMDDHALIELDVPGLKKEDLKITHSGDKLIVVGKGKRSVKKSFLVKGAFYDLDALEAKLEDGILTIKIPKKKEAVSKSFEIK